MSQSKNALTILILASIFLLIASAWDIVAIFYYSITYGYDFYEIMDFIGPVLGIVASLLLMIGFITLRGDSEMSSTATRLCPKCGRNINADAKFCPYCGWKPTGTD